MRVSTLFAFLCADISLSYATTAKADFSPLHVPDAPTNRVTYDNRSFIINGTRTLILSGSVHYPRVHPEEWGTVLDLLVKMGLNAVETYAFWNLHEPETEGNITWSPPELNISGFVQAAADRGLYVIFRLGPYICGEFDFGGIPVWVRDSGTSCMRCSDPIWEEQMARMLSLFVEQLTPHLYPAGPIIDLQVENEYSYGDMEYLIWAVDTARNLTTQVPWSLCHDEVECSQVNQSPGSPPEGKALCTINGFWEEERNSFIMQPSPIWAFTQMKNNPKQFLAWTEDQGWYNFFGGGKRVRYSSDILYGFARFVAYGASMHNFYMVHGGNNFRYMAGFGEGPIGTAYAPDTAIDSYMLRHEPRYSFVRSFLQVLQERSEDLLSNPVATGQPLNANNTEAHVYGNTAFLSNMNDYDNSKENITVHVTFHGQMYVLPPWTVVIIDIPSGSVLFNTSSLSIPQEQEMQRANVERNAKCIESQRVSSSSSSSSWEYYLESFGYGENSVTSSSQPIDQLNLTARNTDYMYYSIPVQLLSSSASSSSFSHTNEALREGGATTITTSPPSITIRTGGGEYVYAFLDGVQVNASSSTAYYVGVAPSSSSSVTASAPVATSEVDERKGSSSTSTSSTSSVLTIFSAAMGLLNGGLEPGMGKGVRNVTVNGVDVSGSWTMKWTLHGEELSIFEQANTNSVQWSPVTSSLPSATQGLVWFRTYVDRPSVSSTDCITDSSPLSTTTTTNNNNNISSSSSSSSSLSLQAPGRGEVLPQILVPGSGNLSYALNMTGLSKGVVWFNGWNLGRYSLEIGGCPSGAHDGSCAPPGHGPHCYEYWMGCGQPSQSLYYVPSPLVLDTQNLVVVFEESTNVHGTSGPRNLNTVELVALTNHPM